jgi:steroid delta-isomerase
MRAAVLKYFASFATADVEAIASLFANDAVIQDPIDGPPIKGRDAIRNFFTSGFAYVGGPYEFVPEGAVRIAGNFAACAAIATCDKANPPFRLDTLDVMEFDADGKIVSMKAYWGPANMQTLGAGDPAAAADAAQRAKAFVASMAN